MGGHEHRARIGRTVSAGLRLHDYGRIYMDTSEFMSIDSGDIIAVGGKHYLVYRDAVEQGLAYKDVKYWVKKCMELESGETKLLKLVFMKVSIWNTAV